MPLSYLVREGMEIHHQLRRRGIRVDSSTLGTVWIIRCNFTFLLGFNYIQVFSEVKFANEILLSLSWCLYIAIQALQSPDFNILFRHFCLISIVTAFWASSKVLRVFALLLTLTTISPLGGISPSWSLKCWTLCSRALADVHLWPSSFLVVQNHQILGFS